jgi:GT2 family glycosyltransferase
MSQEQENTEAAYVLITAAYNEEAFIEATLRSVISQSLLPRKWLVVSDGSTDRTDEIVSRYACDHGFIELLRMETRHQRDFAAKVNALTAGWKQLKDTEYGYIGILDGDISFDKNYYANMLEEFQKQPELGLTGGLVCEERHGNFQYRRSNSLSSVAGATQFFRRECYEAIGGIPNLKYGGEDWCAEISARMKGWVVRGVPGLKVFHHRSTGTAGSLLRHWFRQGRMDSALGSHPLFEFVKCLSRISDKPLLLGAISRFAGFIWSTMTQEQTQVPADVRGFLRHEQKSRLRDSFFLPPHKRETSPYRTAPHE